MADTWYLIIRTPDPSVDIWPVGDYSDIPLTDSYIAAGKALLSVPYEWPEIPGWAVSVAPGLPHPTLLAQGTLHEDPPEL